MNKNSRYYKWEELPNELLQTIGDHLRSRIDVFRFRAVCRSWRSSLSPLHKHAPPLPLTLPGPIFVDSFLTHFTICRIQIPSHELHSDSSSNSKEALPLITKVEESISVPGDLQLLTPFSNQQIIKQSNLGLPKTLNLLNSNLVELMSGYALRLDSSSRSVYGINRVLLFPTPDVALASNDKNIKIGVLLIFHEGKLGFWKSGDEEFKLLDESNFNYDDIIVYKGQYYAVDRCGTVSWIDSSLKLVQYSPPLYGCRAKKNLVESCGELYMVDRYLDRELGRIGEERYWFVNNAIEEQYWLLNNGIEKLIVYPIGGGKAVDVKVYKLDEEWGRWVDVWSLGDRSFVIGNECCFSVSAAELGGSYEGNCVYFMDPVRDYVSGDYNGYGISVFNLSSRRIDKLVNFPSCFQIFWPPPKPAITLADLE